MSSVQECGTKTLGISNKELKVNNIIILKLL